MQKKGWTIGLLANQIWSLGGDNNEANINATYLQPFLNYTTKTHTTLGVDMDKKNPPNWVDDQWTVPFNLTVSQILKIGKQPVSIQLGGRYYAEAPSGGPDWGLRLKFHTALSDFQTQAGSCPRDTRQIESGGPRFFLREMSSRQSRSAEEQMGAHGSKSARIGTRIQEKCCQLTRKKRTTSPGGIHLT